MQIALDALEANLGNWAAKTKAVEVLRQSLVDADDTSQKRVDEIVKTEHDRAVELGKAYERGWNAALAQREWVPEALRLADALDAEFVQGRISNSTGRESAVELRRLALKQWVGLTDEQVEDEWERITGHGIFGGDRSEGRAMYISPDEVIEFSQAIEAKLKEKNT